MNSKININFVVFFPQVITGFMTVNIGIKVVWWCVGGSSLRDCVNKVMYVFTLHCLCVLLHNISVNYIYMIATIIKPAFDITSKAGEVVA